MHNPSKAKNLRTGRHSEAGRIYLITIVVDRRQLIFNDWSSGRHVIQAFKCAQAEKEARSMCWVVMPDHIHWLIELQTDNLPRVISRFKSRSTVWVNRQLGREGRLWQKGFHDQALRQEDDLKACARYVVSNPERAGLVDNIRHYPLWDAVWL